MKAKAPERLYLSKNIYSTYLYQVPDPDDETTVEYISKDAFIERAAEYLQEHLVDYWSQCVTDESKFVADFKRYMKGE